MKIGLFGGAFNPSHMGHLIVLESVRDQLQFDRVMLIPSSNPPNKNVSTLAAAEYRLEMARLAVRGNPDYEVSDIELKRKGITYTIDTIASLVASTPRAQFSLIIGADNFLDFGSWKSPDEILARVSLIVLSRPGFEATAVRSVYSKSARFVHVPAIDISGTDIRRRVKLGRSIRYLVPKYVEDYIYQHHLYKD